MICPCIRPWPFVSALFVAVFGCLAAQPKGAALLLSKPNAVGKIGTNQYVTPTGQLLT